MSAVKQKVILISILIATMAVPMRAALSRTPVRSLRRTALAILAFGALYLLCILYVYPRLF